MSIEAMAVVLHHSKAHGTDKLVLLGIANHHGDGGSWPHVATLAKYANVSERSVQYAIGRLVDAKELKVEYREGGLARTRDQYRTNRYTVLVSCPDDCDGGYNHRTKPPEVQSVAPPEVQSVAPPEVQSVAPEPYIEPSVVEPSTEPSMLQVASSTDVTSVNQGALPLEAANEQDRRREDRGRSREQADVVRFDEFWAVYPRKVAKGQARTAWRRAIKKERADRLIAAAMSLRDDPNLPESTFIPHPATWLNGERWSDGPLASTRNGNGARGGGDRGRAILQRQMEQWAVEGR